jgi:hypothetical protein
MYTYLLTTLVMLDSSLRRYLQLGPSMMFRSGKDTARSLNGVFHWAMKSQRKTLRKTPTEFLTCKECRVFPQVLYPGTSLMVPTVHYLFNVIK